MVARFFYQGMCWSRQLLAFVVEEMVVIKFLSMSFAQEAVEVCVREVICWENCFGCD